MYVDCNFVNNTAPHGHDAVLDCRPITLHLALQAFCWCDPTAHTYLLSRSCLDRPPILPFKFLGLYNSNGNLELTELALRCFEICGRGVTGLRPLRFCRPCF